MFKLPDQLVDAFVKATKDEAPKKTESFMYGTVVTVEDDNVTVLLDGANSGNETPCTASVSVGVGDRVLIMLKNRQAVITSNVSHPSINTEYLEAGDALFTGSIRIQNNNRGWPDTIEIGPDAGAAIQIIGEEVDSVGDGYTASYDSRSVTLGCYNSGNSVHKNLLLEPDAVLVSYSGETSQDSSSAELDAQRLMINTYAASAYFDSTGVHTSSDARLKENVENANPYLAMLLRPVEFNFTKDKKKRYGFIAQEVQEVFPNAVTEADNGYLTLNYVELIAPLYALVQNQQKTIESLERRIQELESERN